MYLRRMTKAEYLAAADFLDPRTMMLRWLVAFLRHQDVFPEEEEPYWSIWIGAREKEPFSCVVAHFFQNGTTYLFLAPGVGPHSLEVLCEEELLPERIVGDRDVLDSWRTSSPRFFEKALRTSEVDVLAYEKGAAGPSGFRAALREDRDILEEYGQSLATELGTDFGCDFDSLIEHGLVFVFEEGGRVQGFIRSNLSDGRYVHGGGLYVHPAYRGRGVGRALAYGLGEHVRLLEGAKVILDVSRENERALRAYLGAGYQKVGSGLEVWFREEGWKGSST